MYQRKYCQRSTIRQESFFAVAYLAGTDLVKGHKGKGLREHSARKVFTR